MRRLAGYWNYKSAVFSASIRGCLFLLTNLHAGAEAAVGAMLAEVTLRLMTAGFYGALTQRASRLASPRLRFVLTLLVIPGIAHGLEFLVHSARGTPALAASLATSIAFTVVSTTFHMFAMRRGVLIAGDGAGSLLDDLRAVPRVILLFLLALTRVCRT